MRNINGKDLTERAALNHILNAYHNGQNKDACDMIEEYGTYDFWNDLRGILNEIYDDDTKTKYILFSSLTIVYNRIKG